MMKTRLSRLLGVVALSASLVGCAYEEPAPKPAAKTAEQPKPAAAPVRSGNSMAIPTGDRATSVLWLERTTPSEVVAGQEFDYSIAVTNLTTYKLKDVSVRDACASNFTLVSSSPQGQGALPNLSWNLGDLNPKETKTITVRGKATGVGQVTSCCWASYNSELCATVNVVQPALKITKSAPAEVSICDSIPIDLVVTNSGSGMARNVVVRDTLPAGLTTADGKTSFEQNVGNLNTGETRKVSVLAKASKTGSFVNSGTASAEGGLTAKSNETTTVVRQPVLEISCNAADRVYINRNATFEFTVKNKGDMACNATVCAPLPAGAQFVSATAGGTASGGKVCWTIGSLAPNATKTVSLTIRPTGMNNLALSADATCACSPAAHTNCQTNVVGIPALLLNGWDDPDPVQIGDNTVYTITVTNQGSANLTNVQVVCTMDEGDTQQFVSATGGQQTVNGRTITFPAIPVLAPGAKQTYTISIKAMKEGQVQFKAEAKSSEITRPLVKIETTNFYK